MQEAGDLLGEYKLEILGISCMCSKNSVLTILGCCKAIGILNVSMLCIREEERWGEMSS
jgi:hypothetical protein